LLPSDRARECERTHESAPSRRAPGQVEVLRRRINEASRPGSTTPDPRLAQLLATHAGRLPGGPVRASCPEGRARRVGRGRRGQRALVADADAAGLGGRGPLWRRLGRRSCEQVIFFCGACQGTKTQFPSAIGANSPPTWPPHPIRAVQAQDARLWRVAGGDPSGGGASVCAAWESMGDRGVPSGRRIPSHRGVHLDVFLAPEPCISSRRIWAQWGGPQLTVSALR